MSIKYILLIGLIMLAPVAEALTIEVNEDNETCTVIVDEVVVDPPPPPEPPPPPGEVTDLGSFNESTWGLHQQRIGRGEIVSYSFSADAMGKSGRIVFTNNMPNLAASGFLFRTWFSASPAGEELNNDSYCSKYSSDPNPMEVKWTQEANPQKWSCDFGYNPKKLYLNMEVSCYEGIGNGNCTIGASYPRDYYVRVYPR
jgi:hypothetical protein